MAICRARHPPSSTVIPVLIVSLRRLTVTEADALCALGGRMLASATAMYQGIVAGAIAGVVGTWAMNEAQRLWTRAVDGPAPYSAGGRHDARDWQERSEHRNSNELAAQSMARCAMGRNLTRSELRVAAPLVHFTFGAAVAAIYGAYVERRQTNGSGAAFGTTVWLAADEIAMPLLGLSDSTARRPLEMHLQAFVAHLVYGTVTEWTRRTLRARLGGPPARRRSTAPAYRGTHVYRASDARRDRQAVINGLAPWSPVLPRLARFQHERTPRP